MHCLIVGFLPFYTRGTTLPAIRKCKDMLLEKFPLSLVRIITARNFSFRELSLTLFDLYERYFFPIGFSLALTMSLVTFISCFRWANAPEEGLALFLIWVFPFWINFIFKRIVLRRRKVCYQILLLEKFLHHALTFCAAVFALGFVSLILFNYIIQTLNITLPDPSLLGISVSMILVFGWMASAISILPISLCQPLISHFYKAELAFRLMAGLSRNLQAAGYITRKQLRWLLKWFNNGLKDVNNLLWREPRRPQIDIPLTQDRLALTLQFEVDMSITHKVFTGLETLCVSLKGKDIRQFVNELGIMLSLEREQYLELRRSSFANVCRFIKTHDKKLSILVTIGIAIISFLGK